MPILHTALSCHYLTNFCEYGCKLSPCFTDTQHLFSHFCFWVILCENLSSQSFLFMSEQRNSVWSASLSVRARTHTHTHTQTLTLRNVVKRPLLPLLILWFGLVSHLIWGCEEARRERMRTGGWMDGSREIEEGGRAKLRNLWRNNFYLSFSVVSSFIQNEKNR